MEDEDVKTKQVTWPVDPEKNPKHMDPPMESDPDPVPENLKRMFLHS